MELQELIGILNEAQLKKGALVSLVSDVESLTGVLIPKRTIVEVVEIKKTGGKVVVMLLSPDDEVFEIELPDIKKFPHKVVK